MPLHTQPSRLVGLEDLHVGDYVTVSHETCEWIPEEGPTYAQVDLKPTRITVVPCHGGWPYQVVSACAPFVLVRDPSGQHLPLDLRRYRLARLSRRYGKKAFKLLARRAD